MVNEDRETLKVILMGLGVAISAGILYAILRKKPEPELVVENG